MKDIETALPDCEFKGLLVINFIYERAFLTDNLFYFLLNKIFSETTSCMSASSNNLTM